MRTKQFPPKLRRRITHPLCLHTTDIHGGYLGGILLVLISVFVRCLSGSPYRYYPALRAICKLPPFALITLIHLLLMFAMGFACGLILCEHGYHPRGDLYRAGMIFVILVTLYMAIHPLLFRIGLPWIAITVLGAVLALSLLCTRLFASIRRLCGMIVLVFSCWVIYLIVILFTCLLHI